jgi:hypothetical protein
VKKALVFGLAVTVLHLILSGIAWSFAGGNAAPGARHGAVATATWDVLRFPLFFAFSRDVVTEWFFPLMMLNSVTWGALCLVIASRVLAAFRR